MEFNFEAVRGQRQGYHQKVVKEFEVNKML